MEARKPAPNVFDLLAEVESLRARVAELAGRLAQAEPLPGETRLFVETERLASQLGAARKLQHAVLYTAAREQEGYASFSDRELGRRLGVDRTSARDVREALVGLGLWEECDYDEVTRCYTHRVRSAAEASRRIQRRPLVADPQQLLWGDEVTEQPVESVDSPTVAGDRESPAAESRRAPEAPSDRAAAADAPPRRVFRADAGPATLGVFSEKNPQPPLGGPTTLGVFPEKNPQRVKTPGKTPTPLGAPRNISARAPDTLRVNTEISSSRVPSARNSESVPCPSVCVRGALDPLARATSEAFAGLGARWLDPAAQQADAAEIARLIGELVRLGGVAPDGGRLHPAAARKIARAVVAGWLDWQDDVLRLLDAGTAKSLADPGRTPAPFVYLVGTMPKLFAERERCWANTTPKRISTPREKPALQRTPPLDSFVRPCLACGKPGTWLGETPLCLDCTSERVQGRLRTEADGSVARWTSDGWRPLPPVDADAPEPAASREAGAVLGTTTPARIAKKKPR